MIWHFSVEHKDAVQAKACRGCGGLAAVIGLQCTAGDQSPGTLFQGFGNEKFQLAGFVATECKAGLVVAFDQDTGSTQGLRKTREFLNRRGQMSKVKS